MDELGKLSLYLCKHVLFEYLNFYANSHQFTKENFSEFTEKMMKSYENPESIWSLFNGTSMMPYQNEMPATNNIKSIIGTEKPKK